MSDVLGQLFGAFVLLGLFLGVVAFAGIFAAFGAGNGIVGAIISVVIFSMLAKMVLGGLAGAM